MKILTKTLKWTWKTLPAGFIIKTFQYLPHSVIKNLGPITITLEPTNACNLSCPLCPRTKLTRGYGSMKFDDYKKIIDTLPWTVRSIELFWLGEPLIAPDIYKMIEYAESKKIKTRISTNATYLKENTDKILDAGLTELIVAIDGTTEDVYLKYRVGGNFSRVIEGVKHFTQRKKERGLKKPAVSFQFVVMKHNQHQIEEVKNLAKELGADFVVLKKVALMNRDPEKRKTLASKYLPTVERFVRKSFIKPNKKQACRWAFSAMVSQNGKITSCCYDWDGKHSHDGGFAKGFKEIYSSPEYTQLRKKIIGQELDICSGCDYNNEISEYVKIKT